MSYFIAGLLSCTEQAFIEGEPSLPQGMYTGGSRNDAKKKDMFVAN